MKMDDDELVALLRRQLTAGQESGPDQAELAKAVDYYYGRPRGDELPGRSTVQSTDVRDMIHAVMAQILNTFTQDEICAFEPDGPGDELQCRLESEAVNRVMMESSRGFVVFYEALKDALLLKNGIIKVWMDDDPQYGRRIRMEAVDPLCFVVGESTSCVLMYETDFCAELKSYTRGELLGMGFGRDDVERVPVEDSLDSSATKARNKQAMGNAQVQAGWANERVQIWEIYSRLADDDGKPEMHRCLLGGQVLLLDEVVDSIPYAAGSAFLEPHKFWGLSYFDLERQVQDGKTGIKRQWQDNLANCNNSRVTTNDAVNIDDLLNTRPGGVVRQRGLAPVGENLMPIPVIDVGPAAVSFLNYMDQVRADRGGAALQMANSEMQTLGAQIGSQGVDRIYSVQEALAGMVARTLAETLLRSTFMLVHRLLRTEYGEELTLRRADQWVTVNPAEWRYRDRINIKAGLSPGERARKASALALVIQTQAQALQMGLDGSLVTADNLYTAYVDWATAAELDAPEKYFTDPSGQASQQTQQRKAQAAQQQQQMQMQLMQVQIQLEQAKLQIEQAKAAQEAQANAAELKFKYYDAQLKAEIEEAKIVGGATLDLTLAEVAGRQQAQQGAGEGNAGGGRRAAA